MFDETPQDETGSLIDLCLDNGVINVEFEAIQNGAHVALALNAQLDLDTDEFLELRVWIGLEDGRASTAMKPKTWISIDGTKYAYGSMGDMAALLRDFPQEIGAELWEAVQVAIQAMHQANHDLEYARTMATSLALDQLNATASDTWDDDEDDDDGEASIEAFVQNCAIDLYRAVTVTEAADAHLGFDITARTLDPTTGDEAPIRVFWRTDPESQQFIHCYGIGDSWCPAHEGDEKIAELMANVPEGSHHHYVHAFDHLHQLAHAAAGVAEDNLAAAVAMIEVEDGPLSQDDVHQLSHKVFASTLVELNPLAWTISGEPDLPSHDG